MGERLETLKLFGLGALAFGGILLSFHCFGKRQYGFELWRETIPLENTDIHLNFNGQKELQNKEKTDKGEARNYGRTIPFQYNGFNIPEYIEMRKFDGF